MTCPPSRPVTDAQRIEAAAAAFARAWMIADTDPDRAWHLIAAAERWIAPVVGPPYGHNPDRTSTLD